MVSSHRFLKVTTLVLVLLQSTLEAKKSSDLNSVCPLGFELAFTKTNEEPICYRLKGPEKAGDMYRDCVGNLYSIQLYRDLITIDGDGKRFWTEYRTSYPGGPFIDWSYRNSTGELLKPIFDNDLSSTTDEREINCVVFDTETNKYQSVVCEGKNYRYCFVKPYPKYPEVMSRNGCEDLEYSWRVSSPRPTCLVAAKAIHDGSLRANWSESLKICKKKGGTLLNRGWIYSNIAWLHTTRKSENLEFPLGVIYYPNYTLKTEDGGSIPFNEWNFIKSEYPTEKSFGFVRNGSWDLANGSYIFYDVICEKSVNLKTIDLRLNIHDDTIVLRTNDTIDKNNISCFTDSDTFYPTRVEILSENKKDKPRNEFKLKPIKNGYYWCAVTDPVNYVPSESNKALFIRVKEDLPSIYAVEIIVRKKYDEDNVEKIDDWPKKIREYIYYYTKYIEEGGKLDEDPERSEETLLNFMKERSDGKERDAVSDVKVKQVNRTGLVILAHMALKATMKPVPPGTWRGIQVKYMASVENCMYGGLRFRGKKIMDCVKHQCLGDFNRGYKDIMLPMDTPCTTTSSPIQLHKEMTVLMPSVGTTLPAATKDLPYRENKSDSSDESSERKPDHDVTTENNTEKPVPPPPPTTPTDPTEVVTVNTPTRPPPPTTTKPTTTDASTTDVPTTTERPRPEPEEQLNDVLQNLESLLNDTAAVLSMENINNTFNQVDELLEENVDLGIPGRLLHLLDEVGGRIELNGTEPTKAVRSNIALLVAEAQPGQPVRGLRIAAADTDFGQFTEDAFSIIREEANSTQLQANESQVVVQLPESVGASTRRISFVVFRNDRAFQTAHYSVNSRVLSVNVENLTQFEQNQYVDIHFSPSGLPNRNESRACAFWEFQEDGSGFWSQAGCTFIKAEIAGALDTCRCDHLTHFAEVLIPKAVFSERNETALELLTVIGCCLSIMGLAMVGLTALLFRSWRRDFSNKIWLHLCIAIFLLVLCFLVVVLVQFDTYNVPCMLIGISLHYSTLASFCWMLVAAVLSYRRLVLVFNRDTSHKLLKAAAFAWGAPFAVVGVLLSVDPHSYAGRFEEMTPTGAFCYPSGLSLWLAVFTPIIVMLIANWTLFVLIVRSVFASRRVQRHGDSQNDALRCASVSCLLVFLFGLPWVFGAFSFNVVAAYFFTLTAPYQGFVLFVFFVLGNKKTRDLWLNKLKIRQTRKIPVTSSTYTNRSTGTSGRPVGPATVEGKVSKPRSLAASDDSRFS